MKTKQKTGAELITAERKRQVWQEGFSAKRDDKYGKELARAAESYLASWTSPDVWDGVKQFPPRPTWNWPWSKKWWKPSADPIRNLVKAGALIAAEIDRLQRKKARKK